MNSIRIWILALLLAACGYGVFWYKYTALEFPLTADKTYDSWYVEARLDIETRKRSRYRDNPAMIHVKLPHSSRELAIVDENIVADDFGHEIATTDYYDNREVTFTRRNIGKREVIFYRGILYHIDSPADEEQIEAAPPKPDSPYSKKNRWRLEETERNSVLLTTIDSVMEEAREKSAGKKSFIRELYKLLKDREDERVELLYNRMGKIESVPGLLRVLAAVDGVNVRIANGLQLDTDRRGAEFIRWAEAYIDGNWKPIDPERGKYGLPGMYLTWWYGDVPFATAESKITISPTISVQQNTNNAMTRAIWKSGEIANVLLKFSFFNLPLETQILFKILLVIPVGALVIAFLRQVIGLKTFGTFMPVLIALAFRETGLLAGTVLFTIIVLMGLLLRAYFDRLRLLLVPRLAAMLTIVVILLSFTAMLAYNLNVMVGLSISLFPIVILTMTIERMSLLLDESGLKVAVGTALGSMLASIIGYFCMYNEVVMHMLFTFPELLLVVLAICILLGSYNGYKLTEYVRFRFLVRQLESQNKGDS